MKLKLLKFNSVKSTNDIAIRLIKKKVKKPSLIFSKNQTKGRGTMGKKWISKKGNLFLSIFFELKQKKINFKHYAILNAYLLKRILSKQFSSKIKIKWPNDLVFAKNKICGILQETITQEKNIFLIVGIGINTNFDPNNKGFSSTSLKNITYKHIDNNKLLNIIKKTYEKFLTKTMTYSYSELKKYVNSL